MLVPFDSPSGSSAGVLGEQLVVVSDCVLELVVEAATVLVLVADDEVEDSLGVDVLDDPVELDVPEPAPRGVEVLEVEEDEPELEVGVEALDEEDDELDVDDAGELERVLTMVLWLWLDGELIDPWFE